LHIHVTIVHVALDKFNLETKMDLLDFEVKRSKVKIMMRLALMMRKPTWNHFFIW